MVDLVIIGGGAAGLAIASYISVNNPQISTTLIEKKETLGKKLSATGNGKCNITNNKCDNFKNTKDFFRSIGIEISNDEDGRFYPVSRSAKDVVEAFTRSIKQGNISVLTNTVVTEINKIDNIFEIKWGDSLIKSKNLVIATGGKSAPEFGGTGDGYKFAKEFGHNVTKLSPVLTSIELKDGGLFNGVRATGSVALLKKGKEIFKEKGEIQFTKEGISGICVFNVSRFLKLDKETKFSDYEVVINLVEDYNIKDILVGRKSIKGLKAKDLLLTVVNSKIAKVILNEIFGDLDRDISTITDNEIDLIIDKLKAMKMKVIGAGGWKQAQCTSGGISLDEINLLTGESKLAAGLYFAGEVIDFDGPCGGYNLQNAWDTAMKVGKNICTEYIK